jgi:hypothetical protein
VAVQDKEAKRDTMTKPAVSVCLLLLLVIGCKQASPQVTAVPLSAWNQHEPEGIPFYLPKPLLVIAKNFRYIEESKVGLTASPPIPNYFDDQAKYGDVNSRTVFQRVQSDTGPGNVSITEGPTNVTVGSAAAASVATPVLHSGGAPLTPNEAPRDSFAPETFYTYQIVFVPDLSQKYGLRIKGGVGEIRAAMNLVNGWQFTGLGPYYMKDSATAQNTLATGIGANLAASGVADVVNSVANAAEAFSGRGISGGSSTVTTTDVKEVFQPLQGLPPSQRLEGFAEIHVFEPQLNQCDGTVSWVPVTDLSFYRDFFATRETSAHSKTESAPPAAGANDRSPGGQPPQVPAPRPVDPPMPPGSPVQLNLNQDFGPSLPPPVSPAPVKHLAFPLGLLHGKPKPRPQVTNTVMHGVENLAGPAAGADNGELELSDPRPHGQ